MERERKVLSVLVVLTLLLWLGFVLHDAPRFPGSLAGSVLAISGGILMVVFSLAYTLIKRLPWLKQKLGNRVSTGDLLIWHVYTGTIGAMLALLHTGHRFESNLGMALTATMLTTVFVGYVGRVLFSRVSLELREKRDQLTKLESAYNQAVADIARSPSPNLAPASTNDLHGWQALRAAARLVLAGAPPRSDASRIVNLAESIAETEYTITHHERFKRLSARWLKIHIVMVVIFCILLVLHAWASIHFGLRWLP